MTQQNVIDIMRDGVVTVLTVSAPLLLVGLLVGLIISIFQATTQINEHTLTFAPKLIAILAVLVITFGWMMTVSGEFAGRIFDFMATLSRR